MKQVFKLLATSINIAAAALLLACQSTPDTAQDAVKTNDSLKMSVKVNPMPEAFLTFLNGFGSALEQETFDSKRLELFWKQMPIKEISTKLCEQYIYGRPIFVASLKDYKAGNNEFFYYVGKLQPNPAYYTLVVVSAIGNDNAAYLLNYGADGAYISGIRLHISGLLHWSGKYDLLPNNEGILVQIWQDDESRKPLTFKINEKGKVVEDGVSK